MCIRDSLRDVLALSRYTSNPSARKHSRCFSISSLHFPSSSDPCTTTHSSRARFVSGHAQHIFFGFPSAPIGADDGDALDAEAPIAMK